MPFFASPHLASCLSAQNWIPEWDFHLTILVKIYINKAGFNFFSDFEMTGCQNRAFKCHPRGKRDPGRPGSDGNCKMPEQDITDLIYGVRKRRTIGYWLEPDNNNCNFT
jgi:hypothetical protein